MTVVAFAPDLGDRSRIAAALDDVTFVREPGELVAAAEAAGAVAVVVDLSRTSVADVLAELVTTVPRVVGFASHVDEHTLEQARSIGVEAMPRSRFFRNFAGLVPGLS